MKKTKTEKACTKAAVDLRAWLQALVDAEVADPAELMAVAEAIAWRARSLRYMARSVYEERAKRRPAP